MNIQKFNETANGAFRIVLLVGIFTLIVGVFGAAPLALATGSNDGDDDNADFGSPNFCADQVLLYAQDVKGITPGPDNDTAIVNDRNGARLLEVFQGSNDDFIFWPQATQITVRAGESLHYSAKAKKTPLLSFDVLNASGAVLRHVVYTGTSGAESITADGFIRFNAGEKAQEYNLLVLCRVQVPPPPVAPTADIKANGSDGPISVSFNTSANLTWTSQNADTCVVTPGSYTGTSGSQTTGNLTAAQTYTLTCTGQGGTATDTVTVNVSAQQITADIKANGSDSAISIAYDTGATLTWTSSGATSCTVTPGSYTGTSGSQSTGNLTVTQNYVLTCTNGSATATDSVAVNVSAQAQVPTVTISANPSSINQGNTSVLTWSSANATSCTAAGGWSGTKALAGNETVTPGVTTTYVVVCVNDAGQSATAQTTVTVTQVSQQVPTLTLYSTPTVINQGQSATLIWNSQNTTTCNATSNWFGTKSLNGSEIVYPSVTTTYSMQCTGTNGQTVTAQATVVVNSYQPPTYYPPTYNPPTYYQPNYYQPYQNPPTVTLYANPTTVNQGQSATLNWYSQNATTCYASGANWSGTKSLTGSEIVYPTQGAVYTITCSNNFGPASDSENIYVIQTAVYYPPVTGQVLGVADIVTGPEDMIPWALGLGFLATLALQFTVLRPKNSIGSQTSPAFSHGAMHQVSGGVASARSQGYSHKEALDTLLADIRERESMPDAPVSSA